MDPPPPSSTRHAIPHHCQQRRTEQPPLRAGGAAACPFQPRTFDRPAPFVNLLNDSACRAGDAGREGAPLQVRIDRAVEACSSWVACSPILHFPAGLVNRFYRRLSWPRGRRQTVMADRVASLPSAPAPR